MQSIETSSNAHGGRKYQRSQFLPVKDSRNRKVRGLWRRGDKWYLQTRVDGEKSARRIPLESNTLEAAKEEVARIKLKKQSDGLMKTGLRPTFASYCEDYLSFFEAIEGSGKRQGTVTRERTSLEQWKRKLGTVRLDKISKPLITQFIDERLKGRVKPRTVNVDVIVLRNVLKKAKDAGLISRLPTEGIKPLPSKTPKRSMLTPTQFQTLCDEARVCGKNGPQLEDYLKFLAFTGARYSEATRIRWDDVDFEKRQVCIGSDGLAKNGLHRFVDFNAQLETLLQGMFNRRAPDSSWVFPSPQRGEKDKPAKSLRESLKIARVNAQLPWVGFHDLRHFFISFAIMSGIDIRTVAEWAGHKDGGVLIGKVYSHLLTDHRQRMAQKLTFTPGLAEKEFADAKTA